MIYLRSSTLSGIGSYNPLDWIKTASGWVWDGIKWTYGEVTDPCTYVTGGLSVIPGGKAWLKGVFSSAASRLGPVDPCSPTGQQIVSTAVTAAMAAHGVNPVLASLLSSYGVSTVVGCVCKSGGIDNLNAPTNLPDKKIPWGPIVAVVGGAVLLGIVVKTRRAT